LGCSEEVGAAGFVAEGKGQARKTALRTETKNLGNVWGNKWFMGWKGLYEVFEVYRGFLENRV
jgi:hypothetical protein